MLLCDASLCLAEPSHWALHWFAAGMQRAEQYCCSCRQDKQQQQECAAQLEAQCDWLEQNADSAGPYFMGISRRPCKCFLLH